jgi:hypothetical protein
VEKNGTSESLVQRSWKCLGNSEGCSPGTEPGTLSLCLGGRRRRVDQGAAFMHSAGRLKSRHCAGNREKGRSVQTSRVHCLETGVLPQGPR